MGQEKTVYLVVDGKALRRTVRIGQRTPGRVEIVEGLQVGDEVVTAGQMKLFDGAAVRTVRPTN
jgi:membrane fusion protein (multidrug efflux system)